MPPGWSQGSGSPRRPSGEHACRPSLAARWTLPPPLTTPSVAPHEERPARNEPERERHERTDRRQSAQDEHDVSIPAARAGERVAEHRDPVEEREQAEPERE